MFCLAISVGLIVTLLDGVASFFFHKGVFGLLILVSVLFVFFVAWWFVLNRNIRVRESERSVQNQGFAFGTWFAAHNLSWSLVLSLSVIALFNFVGEKPWVVIFSAGASACIFFASAGAFIARQRKMLGLCWPSPIPEGLVNFWENAGASLILRERYEFAVAFDQKQLAPVLWSISRVYDRAKVGSADRKLYLIDHSANRSFLFQKFKTEWFHRLKALSVLFLVTALIASLATLLGFTPPHLAHVPGGWNPGKPDRSQLMASKSQSPGESAQNKSDQNKPDSSISKSPGTLEEKGKMGQDQEGNSSDSANGSGQGKGNADNSQKDNKKDSEADGAGGTGQGLGDPKHVPKMSSEPQRLPDLPSRDTRMVSMELPTLKTQTGEKGEPPKNDKPNAKDSIPIQPAPASQFKTGKQDQTISKPDQYLPNWILILYPNTNIREK